MEEFAARQNIERYRRLLGQTCDDAQRMLLSQLLAQEEAKLKRLEASGKRD